VLAGEFPYRLLQRYRKCATLRNTVRRHTGCSLPPNRKQITSVSVVTEVGPVAVLAAAKNGRFNIRVLKSYALLHGDVIISIQQKEIHK
jgi:hypothetical protein